MLFTLNTGRTITLKIVNESTSTAYFDNIQIVEGFIDTRYNWVSNNSFENYYEGWNLFDSDYTDIIEDLGYLEDILGNKSIIITGDGSIRKEFEQEIKNLDGTGLTFVIGGWAKADAVPNKALFIDDGDGDTDIEKTETYSDQRFFGLKFEYDYVLEGQTMHQEKYISFDSSINDWQYQMRSIKLPGYVSNVKISGIYQGEGTAYFDNIQLYVDEIGTEYQYSSTGNLEKIKSKSSDINFEYDSNDKVISMTENGVTTNIERNSSYLIDEVSQNNVTTTLEYDSSTNQLLSTYVGYDKDKPIDQQDKWFKTSTSYTTDYQYIKTIKDEFGNVTTINTDQTVSLISSVIDSLGNTQEYIYNNYGSNTKTCLKSASGTSICADYLYDSSNKLWKIVKDGLTYELHYNELDQVDYILVAETKIMTYYYLEKVNDEGIHYNTDLLASQEYGNGDIISFGYSDENKLQSITFNTEENPRYEYEYDSSGRLTILKDIYNSNIYFYSYDLAGRLEKITDKDGNQIKYSYNSDGNIEEYVYEIGDITRGVQYHYNSVTKEFDYTIYIVNGTPVRKNYNYQDDSLRRLDNIDILIGSGSYDSRTMKFIYDDNNVDSSMGNATSRIYSIEYLHNGIRDFSYYYEYDANHNITGVTVKSRTNEIVDQYDYQYDGFNQLIREDVKINQGEQDETSYTKYFHYDSGGNITDIKTLLYGEKEYTPPYIPSFSEGSTGVFNVKMYYNGSNEYDDVYNLNIGQNPSLSFSYYDTAK